MLESNETQSKLDSSLNKYLLINSELLDPIITSRVSVKDDLVLQQIEQENSSVLQDGKQITESLGKLATEQGYFIVLYSNRKEWQTPVF